MTNWKELIGKTVLVKSNRIPNSEILEYKVFTVSDNNKCVRFSEWINYHGYRYTVWYKNDEYELVDVLNDKKEE